MTDNQDDHEQDGVLGCLWWRLFASDGADLRRWVCLRMWRFVALKKKRRFVKLAVRERLQVEFVEDDLPLHALMVCLASSDPDAQRRRFEWTQRIVRERPRAPELLDRQQRVPLHYALEQQWRDHDQLCWLLAKSQSKLIHKDAEGRNLMTRAVLCGCPQEIVMQMAVELAATALQSLETLLQGRHLESARRLCVRTVEEYFAGVPHFPHAYCLHLLRQRDTLAIIDGMQTVWRDFADKWEYYGVPVVLDDLPLMRHAPLDSFLQLTIKAKGEPLSYQWFCDDEPIAGATQASLFVSQCVQPHNEGLYSCVVSNWKGRAATSAMQLVVVDYKHGPDPSLRFLLDGCDRQALSQRDIVHRISATRGGLVHATACHKEGAIMDGCSLLLPPKCFASFDANGVDVSDTTGMEVVVRQATLTTEEIDVQLRLPRSWKLVSVVVEVLPFSVPLLGQPAVLTIPHCWSAAADPFHELIVVEILTAENASSDSSSSLDATRTAAARKRPYDEVEGSRILTTTDTGGVSFELSRFGRFAVLAKSIASQNEENEAPLENVVLVVRHPARLSAARERSKDGAVACSAWLVLDRPDTLDALHHELASRDEQAANAEITRQTTSSMSLRLRQGQLLHIRMGLKVTISHVWCGPQGGGVVLSTPGIVCLHSDLPLQPQELSLDPHVISLHHDDHPNVSVFRVLEMQVAVIKLSMYQSAKRAASRNSADRSALPEGFILSDKAWRVPIPVVHDAPVEPVQPRLHQRRPHQLAIAYAAASPEPSGDASRHGALFEELHEMEREFTPYFFRLELARFSVTFWHRYDRTWWFDKTNSSILLGMYKPAHAGVHSFAVVASDAFAGAFRVVQCSLDAMGPFSEPLLLEPPNSRSPKGDTDVVGALLNDIGDDDESAVPSGLRRVLALAPTLDLSPQSHASLGRVGVLLETVYTHYANFTDLFGVERTADAVRLHLERQRDRVRAANHDVALLVLAMDRLEHRMEQQIYLRATFFAHTWKRLRLLRRLIPEIDCFPVEYGAVTQGLHAIMRDLFEIVWAVSSPGWFARLLLDEWFEAELQALFSRAHRLLHSEAQALQGSLELADFLESDSNYGTRIAVERQSLREMRKYLMLILGQPAVGGTDEARKQIAAILHSMVPRAITRRLPSEDWGELVARELQSEATTRALQKLRERDTLAIHIRSVSPADQERFSGSKFPASIVFCFGLHVVFVDTQHALKVTNLMLRCGVQGQTEFSRDRKRLVFTPAIPFDNHTRYQVKLRAQYVHTALGGALPPAAIMTFEFSTGA